MRLVITGGGTGGHVFPALEIGSAARQKGWDVAYFGSKRGIEGAQCETAGIPFVGFTSEPLYRPLSPKGIRSVYRIACAVREAFRSLDAKRPDVVFSTGGYASAPVVQAVKKLGLSLVVHEQNTVPGRTNLMAANHAKCVCTVFESTRAHFPVDKVVRTGMPIRSAMRGTGQGSLPLTHSLQSATPIVLVMGGSQGSMALNDAALSAAVRMSRTEVHWLHVTGLSHFESTSESLRKLAVNSEYTIKAYLDAGEMASALFSSSVALCRSGAGTMAELAAFRKPSVLVPFPHAFADHQAKNAHEFEAIGAADMLAQEDLSASAIEGRVLSWLYDEQRRKDAERALAAWDVPDSVEKILGVLSRVSLNGAFVA